MKLSTQPYKGSRDFYPKDMRVQNYIFDTWRKVCIKHGYEEYDGPFIERFDLYSAKTGDEIVNTQLYSFEDRGGRKVAIRPEVTPTLARMVAAKIKTIQKPIKWFTMPNLWRYEKPQKGRMREHYQLNVDIFGVQSINADYEIITILAEILREFGAKDNSFEIRINNRRFMERLYTKLEIPNSKTHSINKLIDKKQKLTDQVFETSLEKDIGLTNKQIDILLKYLQNPILMLKEWSKSIDAAKDIIYLLKLIADTKYDKYVKFDPLVVRGLDYYTGTVFELYNLHPGNNRAMSGGGRYDNLLELFTETKLSGTGFGMGDVTIKDFLEAWGLLPNFESECVCFVTLWPEKDNKYLLASLETAKTLRDRGINTQAWLEPETKLNKQLKFADNKGFSYAIIIGETELDKKLITVKDLNKKTQKTLSLESLIKELK